METENIQKLARIYSSNLCENIQRKFRITKNFYLIDMLIDLCFESRR